MAAALSPDLIVYVCHCCIPDDMELPRQWKQDDVRIVVHEVPCSGKMDGQYLMHALEGGACGVCVVACPKGDCNLGQGNYRAEIRMRTIRRLMGEVGLEPERAELIHSSSSDSPQQFDDNLRSAVGRIIAYGKSPI
jgi:F420-non-reducing hydrogenase iron-sulfur subunit